MIRPLRARQRWIWLVIGLVAGTLLAAALVSRRPVPPMDTLPAAAAAEPVP